MINTQLLVGYKELYNDNDYDISKLVSHLPIKKVGQIISKINLEIHMGNNNDEQLKYLGYFISHWTPLERKKLIHRSIVGKKDYVLPENIHYFSRHSLLYLFFKVLKYSEDPSTGIEQDLSTGERDYFFKAILIANDEVNQRSYSDELDFTNYEEFRKFMWRTSNLQNQFDSTDPIIKIIKAKCLFDLLQSTELYFSEIKKYLYEHEAENTWSMLLRDRLQPYINANKILEKQGETTPTLLLNSPQKKFIERLTINQIDVLGKDFTLKVFKEKPLLKIDAEQCVVLDWGIYNEQLFESIVFDFYNLTDIKGVGGFKKFLHYKNELIDKVFYEDFVLRKLINILFPKKHQIKLSEGDLRKMSKDLTPDYYIRDGNDIYIIEFKNNYYPSSIDKESDYEQIKESIDKKYNADESGVGQQIKRIKHLSSNRFEDAQEPNYPRNRNINIFPVIIFSDVNYNIPGVGRYLNESFKNQIDESTRSQFKNIMPLIFIHVDYFFEHIDLFLKNPSLFKEHLKRFIKYQNVQEKKLAISPNNLIIHQELDIPFTYRIRRLYKYPNNRKDFVQASFDAFDLIQNT